MTGYYEELLVEEQEAVTEVIQLLLRQTFLLERKFDKRAGRLAFVKEYRTCSKHLEFLTEYFKVAGIELHENAQMGLIYIQGETLWGEKLPRLATIYLLILKLIYDEQTRLIIYPCINAVLMGDDIRKLLNTFNEEDNIGEESAVQGTLEDMPE